MKTETQNKQQVASNFFGDRTVMVWKSHQAERIETEYGTVYVPVADPAIKGPTYTPRPKPVVPATIPPAAPAREVRDLPIVVVIKQEEQKSVFHTQNVIDGVICSAGRHDWSNWKHLCGEGDMRICHTCHLMEVKPS